MSDPLEELAKQQQSRRVANVRSRGIRPAQYHAPQPRSSRNPLLVVIACALVAIVVLVIVGVALLGFGIWKTKQAVTSIASESGLTDSPANISPLDNEATELVSGSGLTNAPANNSPLANEARKQAMICFSQHWTQIGQYWTAKISISDRGAFWAYAFKADPLGDHFIQTKDISFDVDASTLSEADKLNGVEFRGTVDVVTRSQVIRTANPKVKIWSQWTNWMSQPFPHGILGEIGVNKINGKWTTEAGPTVAECQTIDPAIIPK